MNDNSQVIYSKLRPYIETLPCIDCHEHLMPFESQYQESTTDMFAQQSYINEFNQVTGC